MKQFTIELSDLSQQHFLSLAQELDLPPETVIETFLDLMVQIFHRNLLATKKDCSRRGKQSLNPISKQASRVAQACAPYDPICPCVKYLFSYSAIKQ